MPSPPFDAAKAVTFDLSRGLIVDGNTGPRVLVPAVALFALCAAAPASASAPVFRTVLRSRLFILLSLVRVSSSAAAYTAFSLELHGTHPLLALQ